MNSNTRATLLDSEFSTIMLALGDAKIKAQAEADKRLNPQARCHAKDKADKYQALHDLLLNAN
tara:strand:- start:80 stop:268 length:189 start_codon:yes stop_codon:yes gene_type:complete